MIKHLFFSSQLRKNMFSGVATTVVNSVVLLVSYPLYLHYLGYEKLGVWMVLSTVLTFVQMCNLGMGPAITKLVAEEHGRGNAEGIQSYVTTALWTLAATGLAALAGLLIFAKPIIGLFRLSPENAAIALDFLPYVGVLTVYAFLIQILTATLSGLGRMDHVNYRDSACRAVSLGISCTLLAMGYGLASLLVGMAVSFVLLHLTSLILVRRAIDLRYLRVAWDAKRFKVLIGFGGGVLGASILSMLLGPFNKVMISRYIGVQAVPAYDIAVSGSMQIRSFVEAALRAMMPEVSRLSGENDGASRDRIRQLYRRAVRIVWLVGLPVFALLFLVASPLLMLWLGHDLPSDLVLTFRLAMVGTFFSLLCVPAYYVLMGFHGIKHCFLSTVVQISVNVLVVASALIFLAAPSLRIFGIAVMGAHSATCAYILWQRRRVLPFCGLAIGPVSSIRTECN